MKTAYISHEDCERHDMGFAHPESPLRLAAILNQLQDTQLEKELEFVRAEEVKPDHLMKVHPVSYIEELDLRTPPKGRIMLDPDTALMKDTMRAARLAAGSAIQAVDLVMSGQHERAFCAVRPPGHHATRNTAMGFCFFNNIAVAAMHALSFHGLDRVAIIDFDVHQGNGTIDIFQDDPRVLFCSSFQHPQYPHSHYCMKEAHIVNTPLPAYTRGTEFRHKVEKDWLHRLQQHKPQLILVSAGFDAHRDDPMADLELTRDDYQWVTDLIVDVARNYADSRVVSILEGGYNLKALAESVEAHLIALSEL